MPIAAMFRFFNKSDEERNISRDVVPPALNGVTHTFESKKHQFDYQLSTPEELTALLPERVESPDFSQSDVGPKWRIAVNPRGVDKERFVISLRLVETEFPLRCRAHLQVLQRDLVVNVLTVTKTFDLQDEWLNSWPTGTAGPTPTCAELRISVEVEYLNGPLVVGLPVPPSVTLVAINGRQFQVPLSSILQHEPDTPFPAGKTRVDIAVEERVISGLAQHLRTGGVLSLKTFVPDLFLLADHFGFAKLREKCTRMMPAAGTTR